MPARARPRAKKRLSEPVPRHPLPESPGFVLCGLLLLSLALNANTFGNALVYDDLEVIKNNEAAWGLRNTVRIFTTPSWWSLAVDYVNHWRPLTTWTYAVNYSLHGLEVAGYHMVNSLIHGVACWLVVRVLVASGATIVAAILTALLFLAHPVHVEAVAWVNGRADLLAGLFMLLALDAHIRGRTALSVFAYACAGMSKETGFMTPFVLLAWDLLIGRRRNLQSAEAQVGSETPASTIPRRLPPPLAWRAYLPHALVLIALLLIRAHFVGGAAKATVSKMASPLSGTASFLERLLTGSYVIARYCWLLIWPQELSVDYGPDAITRVTAFADARALLGFGVVALYLLGAILTARRAPLMSFALILAMMVIAPAANIAFPVGTIMAERLMYLPALALCVPLAAGLAALLEARSRRTLGLLLTTSVLVGCAWRTNARNADWRSEESLFRAAVAVSPNSAMANKNLGGALHNQKRHEEAIPFYERALKILWDFPQAHYELGNCHFSKKPPDYEEAVKEFRLAIKQSPRHASAHMNLGATYHVLGRYEEALREFEEAIKLNPRLDLAWFNRVVTLIALNRLEPAQRAFDGALRKFPDHHMEADVRQRLERARLPSSR